ncbi:hypothetical protein [Vibrio amylolyticus]|uniref:RipA family octameric membrane protein n=1 Tax=Vibrio amylolyticus TaxID=2847292 RepID=UPI003550EE57
MSGMEEKLTTLAAYKIAIETRNFEIDLYWKRSLFFWGFIATAFISYGSLTVESKHNFALATACFGFICSLCWSLVNRGSKYWQEHWETMVTKLESELGNIDLFRAEDTQQHKSHWLNSRKFSVSRTAIALSDFTTLIWFGLILNHLSTMFFGHVSVSSQTKGIVLITFTIIYVGLILKECASGKWKKFSD